MICEASRNSLPNSEGDSWNLEILGGRQSSNLHLSVRVKTQYPPYQYSIFSTNKLDTVPNMGIMKGNYWAHFPQRKVLQLWNDSITGGFCSELEIDEPDLP